MGKAPAVIIIARHGARLDAENKTWHLTSPNPYDPPLSYGGWTQTRALGARIASLLYARDTSWNEIEGDGRRRSSEAPSSTERTTSVPKKAVKRRKRQIIMHSSPFQRCIQSSIGISAGMSQFEGNLAVSDSQASAKPSRLFGGPTRSKTMDTNIFDSKYTPGLRPKTPPTSQSSIPEETPEFVKPLLRVDAFLGEWLTPDYYENITHPPPSDTMVAGAKADLVRSAEPIKGSEVYEDPDSHTTDRRLHGRSISFASDRPSLSASNPEFSEKRNKTVQKPSSQTYKPPSPNYAISPAEPIPDGYVAHARDACVDADFQWDSMQEPQNWGDGGQFGEEWSAMHNRFRKGLMDMIEWYKENGYSHKEKSVHGDVAVTESKEEEEDDSDLVLILVTHSAGCNALIGALTNQPVLIDVGMASLTMAALKDPTASPPTSRPRTESGSSRRQSVVVCPQSDDYEMKIVASTDHLRAGSDVLKIPQLQSPKLMPTINEHKQRRSSISVVASPVEIDRPRSKNSALGSIRRIRPTATTPLNKFPGIPDLASPTGNGGGLWGSRRASVQATQDADVDPLTPEINPMQSADESAESTDNEKAVPSQPGKDKVSELPLQEKMDRRNSRGLWGGNARQDLPRRWTISERSG